MARIISQKRLVGEIIRFVTSGGVKFYEFTDPMTGDVQQFPSLKSAWLSYREIIPDDKWKAGWDARIIGHKPLQARRLFRRHLAEQSTICNVA